MGIVFRQSVKTSIVIFAGAFLGALTIWLSTKYIPKQEFGFIRNLTIQSVLLSNFLLLGTGHVLIVFIHRFIDENSKRKVLITLCCIVPLISTILFSVFYFLFKSYLISHFQPSDIPLIRKYFVWLPIYTLLFIYMSILELYLGTQMKVAVAAFMREIILRLFSIFLILLYAFNVIDFSQLFIGTVLFTLIPTLIFLWLSFKTEKFGFSLKFSALGKNEYKEMLHFSWYHFLLIISTTLLGALDILMLPIYDRNGLSSSAVYGVALFLISFIQMPSKGMINSTYAVLAQSITNNDLPKAKNIFERASVNILIATVGISLVICCNLSNAVAIIKNDYTEVIPVFLILIIGRLIDISTGMNDQVLSITNHYKFNFYVSLGISVFLFLLIRLLIPLYGIYGAAWASSVTLIIYNIVKYYFVWKKLDMQPFSKKTVLVIVAAIPALAAGYFFPYLFEPARHVYVHTFIDASMRSAVIIVVYALMLLLLKPSPDLTEYIASVRKNKRLF
jgi:O-antigen/teichoic acid export membrane protein